jgi:hypothetical protein
MKLYVVVRDDLSVPQKAVQAGHAVAEFLINNETSWSNGTLVYLRVPNEAHLHTLLDKLEDYEMEHSLFREPDLNNEVTALASTEGKRFFSRLKLL